MLYFFAKLVVSASLAFIGLLVVLLSLAALLRVCRRPLVKLPASTLVVLSFFAVISEGVANKMRGGTAFPPRMASGGFVADPDIGEIGELPPVSNLCVSAIVRGTNSTDILISWSGGSRPRGENVDIYATTDLMLWDWTKLYAFDLSSASSNILASVSDILVTTNDVLPQAFYSVGDTTDSDFDGVSDSDERFLSRTDPSQPDTDADGFDDGWEIAHAALGYDPLAADTNGLLAASADLDDDGLTNADEAMLGTDLSDVDGDSDDDGVPDAQEVPVAAIRAQIGFLAAQFIALPNASPNVWNLLPALAGVTSPTPTSASIPIRDVRMRFRSRSPGRRQRLESECSTRKVSSIARRRMMSCLRSRVRQGRCRMCRRPSSRLWKSARGQFRRSQLIDHGISLAFARRQGYCRRLQNQRCIVQSF